MDEKKFRTVRDSLGELHVPSEALYGAHTQRAVENFPISGLTLPFSFLRALSFIKAACAGANHSLGLLDKKIAEAIQQAADEALKTDMKDQFPVDVFQTGSGTSTNMNMNEVISHLASEICQQSVHPNDHVNMSQSSNDVIPTAIHVSACIEIENTLLPALSHLADTIDLRAKELAQIVKTGRTHLMDAMPITFGQELATWSAQVHQCMYRIQSTLTRLRALPIGGTAVGTGVNAHPEFGQHVVTALKKRTGMSFIQMDNLFVGLASQENAVEMSSQLKTLAIVLMKISNDLRWMNSGPLAGIAEITLPALQPGSSIMPGKVNPVIPEAVAMVSTQVIGNDTTITLAGASGNFQLNVMLPVIAYNLLQSIALISNAATVLADKAIKGLTVNEDDIKAAVDKNPILVTALNRVIGYEKGSDIAKKAYSEKRPILDVALEETDLSESELRKLLDPASLTKGGID